MTDDLSPVARACIANARRALAAANETLNPDRRPYVPPEPETPAETYEALMTPTDPDACTCRHDGLPLAWHREFCALDPPRRPPGRPTPTRTDRGELT